MLNEALSAATLGATVLGAVAVLPISKAQKRVGYSAGLALIVIGVGLFFWPADNVQLPNDNRGTQSPSRDVNNNGQIYNGPVTVNPAPPAPTPAPEPTPEPKKEKTAVPLPTINNGIIIQGGNSGNPTINNYGPPPPTIRLVQDAPAPTKGPDGTSHFSWVIEVVGSARVLKCVASPDGNVLSVAFGSSTGTMFSNGPDASGAQTATLQNPVGQYFVQVQAKNEKPIPSMTCGAQ